MEVSAVTGGAQMDQLMEEDVVEDIVGSALQSIGDSNRPIDRGAGTPSLTHLAPTDRGGSLMELGQVTSEKVERSPLQLGFTLSRLLLTCDHPFDQFRDDLRDLGLGRAERDADDDLSALAVGGDVALASPALDDADGGILGEGEAGLERSLTSL